MLRAVLLALFLCLSLLPARAQTDRDADRIDRLYQALAMPDILAIMRQEGIDYGRELALELFGGPAPANWSDLVSEIYDLPRMEEIIREELTGDLAGEDLIPMLDFFESDLGGRIIGLELSARSAMLVPEIDQMARDALADMMRSDAPRLELLFAFSEANDLIEYNVVGAMNSNYAFYLGLSEGGAFGEIFAEDDILADVWSQEQAIRDETSDWLMAYLALAYQPLSDAELEAYVTFSETQAGAVLNSAIFDAFDVMYVSVSLALGTAAASLMASQEL